MGGEPNWAEFRWEKEIISRVPVKRGTSKFVSGPSILHSFLLEIWYCKSKKYLQTEIPPITENISCFLTVTDPLFSIYLLCRGTQPQKSTETRPDSLKHSSNISLKVLEKQLKSLWGWVYLVGFLFLLLFFFPSLDFFCFLFNIILSFQVPLPNHLLGKWAVISKPSPQWSVV